MKEYIKIERAPPRPNATFYLFQHFVIETAPINDVRSLIIFCSRAANDE